MEWVARETGVLGPVGAREAPALARAEDRRDEVHHGHLREVRDLRSGSSGATRHILTRYSMRT